MRRTLTRAFQWCVDNRISSAARLMLRLPYIDPSANDNAALMSACRNGDSNLVQALLDDSRVRVDNGYNQCVIPSVSSGSDEVTSLVLRHTKSNPIAYRKHASLFGWDDKIAEALDDKTTAHETVMIYRDWYWMLDHDVPREELERREREWAALKCDTEMRAR